MTTEYQTQIDNNEERLTAVEARQDNQGRKLDDIDMDIAAAMGEGNALQDSARTGLQDSAWDAANDVLVTYTEHPVVVSLAAAVCARNDCLDFISSRNGRIDV